MSDFKPQIIPGAETTVVSFLNRPVDVDGMEVALTYVSGRADQLAEECPHQENCGIRVQHERIGDGIAQARVDIYNLAYANPNCLHFILDSALEDI